MTLDRKGVPVNGRHSLGLSLLALCDIPVTDILLHTPCGFLAKSLVPSMP